MKPENLTTPNNVRLINLLDTFRQKNGAENSYAHVVMELLQGNSFLLLPSVNEDKCLSRILFSNISIVTSAGPPTSLALNTWPFF